MSKSELLLSNSEGVIVEKEIRVGEIVHCPTADGYCIAGIVSAIVEDGTIYTHAAMIGPNFPMIMNGNPQHHAIPEKGVDLVPGSWHRICECLGEKKLAKKGRIMH